MHASFRPVIFTPLGVVVRGRLGHPVDVDLAAEVQREHDPEEARGELVGALRPHPRRPCDVPVPLHVVRDAVGGLDDIAAPGPPPLWPALLLALPGLVRVVEAQLALPLREAAVIDVLHPQSGLGPHGAQVPRGWRVIEADHRRGAVDSRAEAVADARGAPHHAARAPVGHVGYVLRVGVDTIRVGSVAAVTAHCRDCGVAHVQRAPAGHPLGAAPALLVA
mmetsp:Transcript_70555/g.223548  ORF Transcript_70555/g.223548 Transcript_70555/m.223548 type:complete len:221 (+) Transcript_70555:341-1003(+)